MAHDVFISYSTRDTNTALAAVNALESKGIRCWIAPRDIKGGEVWAEAIVTAITGCRVQVLIFSSHANRSGHVVNEVDAAIRKGAIVVPFRIENVMPDGAMEFHLRTRHWLDALTPDLAKHLGDLVTTVQAILGQSPAPAPATEFGVSPAPANPTPSKARPVVQSTPSGFHVRLPKPAGIGKAARRWGALLGVGAAAILGVVWYSGRGSTLAPFEFRARTDASEFRATIRPTAIKFFEDAQHPAPLGQRHYSARFVAAQARYIYTEVDLALEAPQRQLYVPLACTIFDGADLVIANFTLGNRIAPTATTWFNEVGWGAANGGNWKPGRYRADCRYGDKLVARGRFEVLD